MALVLGGTAALSAALIASSALRPTIPVVPLAFAAYLALALWAMLAPPGQAGRPLWPASLGPLALAASLMVALLDRHQLVASRTVAPDDVAATATAVALVAIAVRAPRLAGRPLVMGAALAAYALIGISFVAGASYHSDAVANVHHAAELLVSGSDPYRSLDTLAALDRFGIDRDYATHVVDGTPLRSFNYPALAVLLPAPFVGLGLADLRPLYLALLIGACLAAIAAVSAPWRPFVLAAAIGNVAIARQHVLAGIDPTWAILLGAALLALERARRGATGLAVLSAVLLGLACASRQPAWFAVPLVVAAVWRDRGAAPAARYAAVVLIAFLVPAVPFLAVAPGAYVAGVLAPILLPLEPHGVGLAWLGQTGALPLLDRGVYAVLALGALAVAGVAAHRRRPALPAVAVLALAPVYLAWRALQSYFTFAGPFAALAVALESDAAAGEELHEPVLSRQSLEVHDAR